MNLKELARVGAAIRVSELKAELAEIFRAFPRLRGGGRKADVESADGSVVVRRRRKRKPMSAAQKAAVSRRMKKYWAARRKA